VEMAAHYWQCADEDLQCSRSTAPLSSCGKDRIAFAMSDLGATNVVLAADSMPEQYLHSIELHRVTHIFLPPTAFYALLVHPDVRRVRSLQPPNALAAASPVVAPNRFKEGSGNLRPLYVPVLRPDRSSHADDLAGPCETGGSRLPLATTRESLAKLRQSHVRCCVSQSWMMREGSCPPINPERLSLAERWLPPAIHNLPEATDAEIRTFGWHHTGDLSDTAIEDGYFYIVDRKKDMIYPRGTCFNVVSDVKSKQPSWPCRKCMSARWLAFPMKPGAKP